MVSEKLRKVRKGVQQRKQAVADRRERARFGLALKKSKVVESGPVQEAKATKRELKLLGREVIGPAKTAGEKAAAAGKSAQQAIESLDKQFGDPTRPRGGEISQLESEAVEQGVKAGDTAFKNKIKRQVKADRLEKLENARPDDFGMAGADFDIDLEVVDDLERGEPGGMGDLGLDTVFDAKPGVGLLGEGDPNDLEVVGESMDEIDRDLMRELGGK